MSARRTDQMLTRRRLLTGAATLAAGGAAAGIGIERALRAPAPAVHLGAQPHGLPDRQHAWNASLARDADGNPVSPRFDRLLLLDVEEATPQHARVLEAALRALERRYPWSPSGLLFTVAWGPGYFRRVLGVSSPIPRAKPLADFELPLIDDYDVCIHLAGDDEARLATAERELRHGAGEHGAPGSTGIAGALRWHETRTGFVGAGLPASHQDVGGIPAGHPVAPGAPLFMGFKSSLRRNQASEDDVTILDGPFAGGTTMHVSYMRLRLDSWYRDLDERERVARMYAPQVSPAQVARFTTDARSDPGKLSEAITRYGVIGHAQTSARARRNGRPVILRRDFNTVDGGEAGLHFVAIQRTIDDFVRTRTAMNASTAALENPAITATVNNGINEFIFVLRRANYIVPARRDRSFPLLPGRDFALT